jgi:two-component system LytT family sensor kinase
MLKSYSESRILSFLSGRLARNVYFWTILIWTRSDYDYTTIETCFSAFIMVILMVLLYTNNLLFIPRFLAQKKYKDYIIRYALLVAITSFLYVLTYKIMVNLFPSALIWKVSPLLSSNETSSLSFDGFLREQPFYFTALFVAGSIFAMSWYVMDYQRQQKIIETVRKEHLEIELNFLKSQINPHFLFNTMNNLYTLTIKKSNDAPEIVSKLSSILRYLLYESNTSLVHFEKEKEIMLAYINLEQLRLSDKNNMTFNIASDKNYLIPPLLWVPVMENVFKHGTRFISQEFSIDYNFSIKDGVLCIYSRNKYRPTEKIGEQSPQGIGLANLKKRLELLFPGKFNMDAKSVDNFYTTVITIQLT